MKKTFLAGLLVLAAALPASAARIHYLDSPEVRPAPSGGELAGKKFFWDEETHRFAVALTYAPSSPPLVFHFPRIRHEDGKGRFVLDLGNGGSAAVAYKFFFGKVHLADRNHLAIHRRHGVVRVMLEIEE